MIGKNNLCWICHSECASSDNAFDQKNMSPCLCKGSLESLHRECLNTWVTKRYKEILNEISFSELQDLSEGTTDPQLSRKLEICCPNCKYPLKYDVRELPPQIFKVSDIFKSGQREKIILFALIGIQIIFLFLDWVPSSYKSSEALEEKAESLDLVNALYILTVLIILCAATYNLVFDSKINWLIEIKDKDSVQSSTQNHISKANDETSSNRQ